MGTRDEPQPVRLPATRVNGVGTGPITVLLCEAGQDRARATKQALEHDGFVVDVCHTAREGIGRLFSQDYAAYVIDTALPDLTGVEALRRMITLKPRAVAIMLTGREEQAAVVEIMRLGAYYILTSPDLHYLSALSLTIREGLDRRRVRGERDQLQTELWEHARLLEERNAELRRKEQEMRRVDQLRSDFVSTASHELRTPLATLKEFTELLADQFAGPVTPEQQNYLSIMQTNIKRLWRIIDELLSMSVMEAGRLMLNKEVVEVEPLVSQIIELMRPLANAKQVTLSLDLPQTLPAMFADADKVTQILINLVGNAIKFMDAPGRVTVSVGEQPNEIEFRVEDTGPGIAPDDLPKLFEKFQKLRTASGKPHAEGTGLGLAISKQLVELHGGRIGVTSTPGQGSLFFFTLPRYNIEELFQEHFKAGIAEAKRQQTRFSIVVISIQNFQELRALYGAEEASRLLRDLETVLKESVRQRVGDLVVRWRQGEMVIILAEVNKAGAEAMASRLQEMAAAHPFRIGSKTITVPIATATATYPDDGLTEEMLLQLTQRQLHYVDQPKTRIMVIDDESKIRQFLKDTLELREYEVLTAASGPDGLEQLKRSPVDLVLLDLMMPVMDGYEVYHLLKEDPMTKDVPVIIVTAKGERKDRQLGMENATYNYISKPFQLEDLLAKVREVLQRQVVRH